MRYGKKSNKVKDTLEIDAQKICNRVIKITDVDLSLIFGYRSPEEQFELFKLGREKIDGIWKIIEIRKVVTYKDGYIKPSKHNVKPSPAWDFCAYVKGKSNLAYDQKYLCYLAGVFITVAEELYDFGKINHLIRWGGNWDKDGEIITDQNFQDLCHCELYKPI